MTTVGWVTFLVCVVLVFLLQSNHERRIANMERLWREQLEERLAQLQHKHGEDVGNRTMWGGK